MGLQATRSKDGESRVTVRLELRLDGTDMAKLLAMAAGAAKERVVKGQYWSQRVIGERVREGCAAYSLEVLDWPEINERRDYDDIEWARAAIQYHWPSLKVDDGPELPEWLADEEGDG